MPSRLGRRLRRVRRPLLALVVLVLALGIGYGVKAARGQPPDGPAQVPVTSTAPAAVSTAPSTRPATAAATPVGRSLRP